MESGDSDQGAEFFCNKALVISLNLPFEDVGVYLNDVSHQIPLEARILDVQVI